MKRSFIFILAAAAFVGCTQIEPIPAIEQPETVDSFTVSVSGQNAETKTCIDGTSFKWTSGDELLVSTTKIVDAGGVASYKVYTTTADKEETATFTSANPVGTLPDGEKYIVMYSGTVDAGSKAFMGQRFDATNDNSAYYLFASVPSQQTYSADGLAPYTMPMYAVTSSLDNVKMTSLATIVRIKLYGTGSEKIKRIKLTSTNGYYIAGTYAIGKQTTGAGGALYTQDAYDVFSAGNNYFGMWNEQSTSSNSGSLDVTLDCGANGVTVSSDENSPTEFNLVIAHRNGADPQLNISIQKVGEEYYSVPQALNIPAGWVHNKIYSTTRSISSFTWQTPSKSVACWGDSFTTWQGAQEYPSKLQSYLGPDWYVYDGGVGGDKTYDVMMRQGSVRWKFRQSYSLTYGYSATVNMGTNSIYMEPIPNVMTTTSNVYRWNNTSWLIPRLISPCEINGVTCEIDYGKITPLEDCINVSGDWVTPYGATVTKNADVNIFYIGRNGGHTGYQQLAAQLQTMVDFADNDQYLVLGFHEPISSLSSLLGCTDAEYNGLMTSTFGDHFLNFNKEIRARYKELLVKTGVCASEADVPSSETTEVNNGRIPKAFYSSDFHPSAYGFQAEAMLIHDKLVKLGYVQDSYILSDGADL